MGKGVFSYRNNDVKFRSVRRADSATWYLFSACGSAFVTSINCLQIALLGAWQYEPHFICNQNFSYRCLLRFSSTTIVRFTITLCSIPPSKPVLGTWLWSQRIHSNEQMQRRIDLDCRDHVLHRTTVKERCDLDHQVLYWISFTIRWNQLIFHQTTKLSNEGKESWSQWILFTFRQWTWYEFSQRNDPIYHLWRSPLLVVLVISFLSASQRRFQSSASTAFITKHKTAHSKDAWRSAWLSDPSTYPLISIMGIAGCLVVGVGSSCLMYNPDVQINPNKRGSPIRTWEFWKSWRVTVKIERETEILELKHWCDVDRCCHQASVMRSKRIYPVWLLP
jgi:hypothetical protein